MQKSKVRVNGLALLPACAICVLVALIVSVCGALVGAICIQNEYIDITAVVAVAIFIQLISGFLGSFLVGRITKEGKILSCSLTGCVYYSVLLAAALLFFDGIGSGALAGVFVCALSSFGGFLLSTREKNIRKRKRKGKRSC